MASTSWSYLQAGSCTSGAVLPALAVIVLNWEVLDIASMLHLWRIATIRMCADGGSNRVFDLAHRHGQASALVPDTIVGDLDSIRSEVRTFYAERGSEIIHRPDQDHHDLHKCLAVLSERQAEELGDGGGRRLTVLVVGALDGRLDQQMANLNMGYRWWTSFEQILFASRHSLAVVLHPGVVHCLAPASGFEGYPVESFIGAPPTTSKSVFA